MRKGTGIVRGAAYVGWDATYSFNVDGRAIPAESIAMMQFPQWPLTRTVEFTASGSGAFAAPNFDVKGRILDLFVRDEGIGHATFNVVVRGDATNFDFVAASPRLSVTGLGKTTRLKPYTGEISLRFVQTSLDPVLAAVTTEFAALSPRWWPREPSAPEARSPSPIPSRRMSRSTRLTSRCTIIRCTTMVRSTSGSNQGVVKLRQLKFAGKTRTCG